jgi:hypothetical protein
MARKRRFVWYDPELEKERREFFISAKMGKDISEMKKKVEGLSPATKWWLGVFIGGAVSALVAIAITVYFNVGFNSLEEVNTALKAQFLIDAILVGMMAMFIGLLLRESRS